MFILHKQEGFTLVELMIVIAIIGILVAVAIPQYQIFVGKTQAARLSSELAELRLTVEECINNGQSQIGVNTGQCTPRASASNLIRGGSQVGITLPNNMGVAQITNPITVNASITAIVADEVIPDLKGKKMVWIRSSEGDWHCEANINSKYLSSGCLYNASL